MVLLSDIVNIRNVRFSRSLLIYILLNTIKNYTTIHLFAVKLGKCVGGCNTLNDL